MATIKDIARIAGVSQGTVSNVLNGRSNVSAEKIRLVREVAQQLGYSINMQAKQLRGDPKNASSIALILPNITERKYSQLFELVEDYFERQQKKVFLFITKGLAHIEHEIVETIAAMRVSGVISVTCYGDVQRTYRTLLQSGAQVIFALHDSQGCGDVITFDYYKAGQEIAEKALSLGVKTIGLMDCPGSFSETVSFENGLRDTFCRVCTSENRPEPTLMVQKSNLTSAWKSVAPYFAEGTVPELIICASQEYADQLCFAMEVTASHQSPIIIALTDYSLCIPKSKVLHYFLDYGGLGRRAAEQLDKKICAQREGKLEVTACRSTVLPPRGFVFESPLPLMRRTRIRTLLMKSQTSDALMSIARQFSEKTNIEIDFVVLPPEEIYETCMDMDAVSSFDVVRASVSILPIMPMQAFRPFSREDYSFITGSMLPMVIEPLSLVGGEPYAIPFDIGSQVLVYRRDIFMDPMVKRLYFEKFGEILKVPADFDTFNRITAFFNRKKNPHSPVQYGAVASIGTDSEAFLSFILRYRALTEDMRDDNRFINFDVFASCRALAQCKDFFQNTCVINKSSWFGMAHDNFINGRCAMAIISFNYASSITELHTLGTNTQIGYSMIPGQRPGLGGGSMLITRHCKEYQAALQFIAWACGQENAELLTYLGGTSPHRHVYQNQEILRLYPWYRMLEETLSLSSYRELWDQFHVNALEHLIGNAMRNIISGEMTPQKASSFIGNQLFSCRLKT